MTIYSKDLAKYRLRVEAARLIPDYQKVRKKELAEIVNILDKMIEKAEKKPNLAPIPEGIENDYKIS